MTSLGKALSVIIFVLTLSVVSNLAIAQNLQLISTINPNLFMVNDIEVSGRYVYLGGGAFTANGLLIVDITNPAYPQIINQATQTYGIQNFQYSESKLFALLPNQPYFRIIDVSNPITPTVIGTYTDTIAGPDVCKIGDYVYIAGDSILIILNVSDPTNPNLVSYYPSNFTSAHLAAQGNYLFAGCYYGIYVYDVSNPESVSLVKHEPISADDIIINNNLLYATINDGGYYMPGSQTTILDVSNPADPIFLGTSPIGGYDISASNTYAFIVNQSEVLGGYPSHQTYLDVLDITNPTTPIHVSHDDLGINSATYSLAARHDTLFLANCYIADPRFSIYHLLEIGQGTLAGRVLDKYNHLPVANAVISVIHTEAIDTADTGGYFAFPNLYNLHYELQISAPGYYSRADTGYFVIINDTAFYDIYLDRPTQIDVGITSIISPPSIIRPDTTYSLKANVHNYGSQSAYSIETVLEIYYSNAEYPFIVDTTYLDSLTAGATRPVLYTDSLNLPAETSIVIVAYTNLAGDEDRVNDTCYFIDNSYPAVEIWYGKVGGSPITASIDGTILLNVYLRTHPAAYIAFLHLCLGANNTYIDTFISQSAGSIDSSYYHLAWRDYSFLSQQGSPPNPAGWSSQSFLSFMGDYGRPLHSTTPIKILSFAMKVVNDSSIIGDTVDCIGRGISRNLGYSWAGDTVGGPGYFVREHFSPIVFMHGCDYVLGDINGDGHPIGGDVTYAVRYFKSQGPPPVDSCFMDSTGSWFYPAGDVNGNCEFRGSDITRMVAYFKSTASMSYCHFFPPR